MLDLLQFALTFAFGCYAYACGTQHAKRRYWQQAADARAEGFEAGFRLGKFAVTQPRGPDGRWARKPTIAPIFNPIVLKPKSLRK